MVVGGHPADSIDRAGGTMAIHAHRGDKVSAVILTTGAHTHAVDLRDSMRSADSIDRAQARIRMEEISERKREQVIEGLKLLAVSDVHFVGEEDYAILPDKAIVLRLARIIRRVRPDVVITHHPFDQPSYMLLDAHGVTTRCTLQAISAASRPDPDDPEPPARQPVQILWHFMHPFHPMAINYDYWWDLCIDISQVVEQKIAALKMISTQHWDRYAPKYVEAQSGWAGVLSKTGHAELFIRNLPEVHAELPVSELQRSLVQQLPHEAWNRMSRVIDPTAKEQMQSNRG